MMEQYMWMITATRGHRVQVNQMQSVFFQVLALYDINVAQTLYSNRFTGRTQSMHFSITTLPFQRLLSMEDY